MDRINEMVHTQLVEHAQRYFNAILVINEERKNKLTPGTYTAKELTDNMKAACGRYLLPDNEEFDGLLDITAETFHCSFRYRDIFCILSEWEAMAKPGKAKAVFEIEGAEEKTAPVLLAEKTVMGAYKTKKLRLVRIAGNWWRARKVSKSGMNPVYYELNGVIFNPGKYASDYDFEEGRDRLVAFCEEWNDEKILPLLSGYVKCKDNANNDFIGYYKEVVNRANIDLEERKMKPMAETTEEERPTLDDTLYYVWLKSAEERGYRTVTEQALAEALAWIYMAAFRSGEGHIVVMNNNGELVETTFGRTTPSAEPTQTHETTETENCTAKEVKREKRTFDALAILEAFTRWRRGTQLSDIRRTADGSTLRPIEPYGIFHAIRPTAPPGADRPPRAGPPLYNPYHTLIHSPP